MPTVLPLEISIWLNKILYTRYTFEEHFYCSIQPSIWHLFAYEMLSFKVGYLKAGRVLVHPRHIDKGEENPFLEVYDNQPSPSLFLTNPVVTNKEKRSRKRSTKKIGIKVSNIKSSLQVHSGTKSLTCEGLNTEEGNIIGNESFFFQWCCDCRPIVVHWFGFVWAIFLIRFLFLIEILKGVERQDCLLFHRPKLFMRTLVQAFGDGLVFETSISVFPRSLCASNVDVPNTKTLSGMRYGCKDHPCVPPFLIVVTEVYPRSIFLSFNGEAHFLKTPQSIKELQKSAVFADLWSWRIASLKPQGICSAESEEDQSGWFGEGRRRYLGFCIKVTIRWNCYFRALLEWLWGNILFQGWRCLKNANQNGNYGD